MSACFPPGIQPPDDDVVYLAVIPNPEEFSCCEALDADDFLHQVSGRVVFCGSGGEVLAEAGRFELIQVDVEGAMNEHISVFDVFDTREQAFRYYEQLYGNSFGFKPGVLRALGCEDEWLPMGLLIVTRLELRPEYRSHGYGLDAMRALIQRYRMGVGVIAIQPFPLQYEGEPTEEALRARGLEKYVGTFEMCAAKLRRHYAQLGFKRIPRTPFMARAATLPLRPASMLRSA